MAGRSASHCESGEGGLRVATQGWPPRPPDSCALVSAGPGACACQLSETEGIGSGSCSANGCVPSRAARLAALSACLGDGATSAQVAQSTESAGGADAVRTLELGGGRPSWTHLVPGALATRDGRCCTPQRRRGSLARACAYGRWRRPCTFRWVAAVGGPAARPGGGGGRRRH